MNNEQQVLVHDDVAEKYVIGCLLIDKTVYSRISQYVDTNCFYNATYSELWDIIDRLNKDGLPVDLITVSSELLKSSSKISASDLVKITNSVATSVNVEYHSMRLKTLDQRRKMWEVGVKISQAGLSEDTPITDFHREAVTGINNIFDKADGVSTLSDALDGLNDIISRNLQGGCISGTPTGFHVFDRKGGLHKTDLIIVAGETSMGKTSLALTMTRHALIEGGAKIAFYSMEMTKEQLAARMISSMTNITANSILYSGQLTNQELSLIDEAKGKLPSENLFFDDRSTSNLESILTSIRSLKIQSDIDGVVVDYLQILSVNTKGSNREQTMGEAARRLKNIAKELDIWVVALSQLSRDSSSPEPSLNRLRDSGQIGEAADVVMLVYRPEYYNRTYPSPYDNLEEYPTNGTAMVDVAKGRNIGIFKFFLGFNKSTTNFYETDDIHDDISQPLYFPIEDNAPF